MALPDGLVRPVRRLGKVTGEPGLTLIAEAGLFLLYLRVPPAGRLLEWGEFSFSRNAARLAAELIPGVLVAPTGQIMRMQS